MKQPKDCIVFPLDVPSEDDAKRSVELLADVVGMFKVGLELFVRCGPGIVAFIRAAGPAGVFLDLKLHDIPATVSRAMAGVAELGVKLATVHCGEDARMLAAAAAAAGGRVGVLGITVLTSVSAADIAGAGFRGDLAADLPRLVMKRAEMARAAGCAGAERPELRLRHEPTDHVDRLLLEADRAGDRVDHPVLRAEERHLVGLRNYAERCGMTTPSSISLPSSQPAV